MRYNGEEKKAGRGGAINTGHAPNHLAAGDSAQMAADESNTSGKAPAFQFYPKDFVTGTLTLSAEEVGVYMLLICHCWDYGFIPADVKLLARIARLSPTRMRRVWDAIGAKFQAENGVFIQPRIEKERRKQAEYRQRQAEASRKRWDSQASPKPDAPGMPVDMPEASSPVSSLQTAVNKDKDLPTPKARRDVHLVENLKTDEDTDALTSRVLEAALLGGERTAVIRAVDGRARMAGAHQGPAGSSTAGVSDPGADESGDGRGHAGLGETARQTAATGSGGTGAAAGAGAGHGPSVDARRSAAGVSGNRGSGGFVRLGAIGR